MVEVSIIIPVYNVEKYIERCLKSIQAQDYMDFEVLIIDDGSTDSTELRVKETICDDNRFKYFHQDNQGVSSARNNGLKRCNGRYVTFIDSDDYVSSEHLSSLLLPYKNEKTDLSVSGFVYEDDSHRSMMQTTKKQKRMGEIAALNSIFCKKGIEGITVNKLFKNNILKENHISFNTQLTKYEDHVFCFEYLLRANNIYYSGLNTYHYVKNSNGLLHSLDNLNFNNEIRACELMKSYLDDEYLKAKSVYLSIKLMGIDIGINNYLNTRNDSEKRKIKKYIKKNLAFKDIFRNFELKNFLKKFYFFYFVRIF